MALSEQTSEKLKRFGEKDPKAAERIKEWSDTVEELKAKGHPWPTETAFGNEPRVDGDLVDYHKSR